MADRAAIAAHLAAARPRAIAALLAWCRDMDIAEDGFQTAALRAAKLWPEEGLPRDPTAWLLHVARNAGRDALRKRKRQAEDTLDMDAPLADPNQPQAEEAIDDGRFRDDVLRLLFLCCHPTLKPGDQVLLCLRYVLGLGVNDLARAHITSADTVQRRITRARARAQDCLSAGAADIAPDDRAESIAQVRGALYLMFNKGYGASHDEPHVQPVLVREAIRLARLLIALFPGEPESLGLLALFLGQSARLGARLDAAGALIKLSDQDRSLWDQSMIAEAGQCLQNALRTGQPGSYQIQAAIAAVHNGAQHEEETDWAEIHRLYQALEVLMPTPVVRLNSIVAASRLNGPHAALADLKTLAAPLVGYLPYHAVRAGLLEEAGQIEDALGAVEAALKCYPSHEEKNHLLRELVRLGVQAGRG